MGQVKLPTVEIETELLEQVGNIELDEEKYAKYLQYKGAKAGIIGGLTVKFGIGEEYEGEYVDKGGGTVQVFWAPGRNEARLNRTLRHESVHFLCQKANLPREIVRQGIIVGRMAIGGAVAVQFVLAGINGLPLSQDIALMGVTSSSFLVTETISYQLRRSEEASACSHENDPDIIRKFGNFITLT